jgi:Ca-activated chloride channel family protein
MNTMIFAYPAAFALLLFVPLLLALRFAPKLHSKREATFLFSRTQAIASHAQTWRTRLLPLPDVLLIAAFICVTIALARPQTIIAEEVEVEGIDIFLALDLSGSMLAIDLTLQEIRQRERAGKKVNNRFEDAINTLKEFVATRRFDRIGMVVFAKDAYLQFPLTLDYGTILNMLDQLRMGDIDKGGTAIGNAIGRSISGLKDSQATTRIIILITDGDRRGGQLSPKQAAEMAKKLGIRVFPILVGKSERTLVPVGRDFLSGNVSYQEMEFPIDPELLKEIAQITDGTYFRAQDAEQLKQGLHEILDEFERSRIQDATNVEHQERFHPFLFAAILLMATQLVLRHALLRKFP